MSRERPRDLAASVAAHLRQSSQRTGEDHQILLTRYGLERLMYRLSRSASADRFVVKGALAFLVWADEPFRVTRDLDLLAIPEPASDELLELFRSLCRMVVDDDGLVFDEGATLTVTEIREDQQYGGLRVNMKARLGKIRIPIQVDVGFGDAVTPEPRVERFPVLLAFPPPVLRVYPRETVVAEKAEAMVQLGLVNSRMKDYYDLWVLMREFEFDGAMLRRAIVATFNRRKTTIPSDVPAGLTDQFAEDKVKHNQWAVFIRRTHAKKAADVELKTVVEGIRTFLIPPMLAAGESKPFARKWPRGGPWQDTQNIMQQ